MKVGEGRTRAERDAGAGLRSHPEHLGRDPG